MADHVYKIIEVTGTSRNSPTEAIENAVTRASKTVEHLRWFQVKEVRGDIADGRVDHWQVTVKIGFTLND